MSYIENVKESLKLVFFFDKESISNVSNNELASKFGIYTLVIAGIAMAISTLDYVTVIFTPPILIIYAMVNGLIYHGIAKYLFSGMATFEEYFRPFSNSYVLYWFSFIPYIGPFLLSISGIWMIIVNAYILNKVHKLSIFRSFIVSLFPFFLIILLVGVMAYFGILSPTNFLPQIPVA